MIGWKTAKKIFVAKAEHQLIDSKAQRLNIDYEYIIILFITATKKQKILVGIVEECNIGFGGLFSLKN